MPVNHAQLLRSEMNDQFQHVMVLTSIIIGLGITHLLLGVNTAIDLSGNGNRRVRLSWASGLWLAYLFVVMVLFWWWEFRLLDILKHWSLWNYSVVIFYAMALFFAVALFIPRDWSQVTNLDDYFLSKHRWFYAALMLTLIIDFLDSYAKGGMKYVWGTSVLTWGMNIAGLPVTIVGFRSANIRTHAIMAALFLLWQLVIGLDVFPMLHA